MFNFNSERLIVIFFQINSKRKKDLQ